jgi:peptidoglycan/LPS O-acetylase OafA/YrhL
LGDISYSMYIVHYSCILAFDGGISSHVSHIFGAERSGHVNRFFANVYKTVLMQCIVIWVADLFLGVVEIPSTKFVRWFEQKCKISLSS